MKKIAIIEDDSVFSTLYKFVLSKTPFQCTYYQTYSESLGAFQAGLTPDLILLDIQLSDRDYNGVDLAFEIRALGVSCPILFVTSSPDDWIEKHLLQDIKQLEPCECLHKPFKVDAFEGLLHALLEGQQAVPSKERV